MAELIEVKNLKKYFKVPAGMNHAVDDVSFTIRKRETLGVVGESGCGKSTLGRAIIRLHEATDGQVLLHGEDITHIKGKKLTAAREKMQIIFLRKTLSTPVRAAAVLLPTARHTIRRYCCACRKSPARRGKGHHAKSKPKGLFPDFRCFHGNISFLNL